MPPMPAVFLEGLLAQFGGTLKDVLKTANATSTKAKFKVKPKEPDTFEGVRNRKALNTWLLELEQYFRAAK